MASEALKSFNPPSLKYAFRLNRPVAEGSLTGLFGLEIELEGQDAFPRLLVHPKTRVDGYSWQWKEDGSLRNGCEYVTNTAVSAEAVQPLCEGLYSELTAAGARLNLSSRCSTHVHVNMQGLTINKVCSFVTLWATFENILVNWCGPGRVGNLFCLRLSDTQRAVDHWVSFFKTGKRNFKTDYKYLALNGSRLSDLGSLEVRSLEGCSKPDRIVKWVSALNRLRYLAVEKYENPADIAGDLSVYGGKRFLEVCFEGLDILPELIAVSELDYGLSIEDSVFEGYRRIQPATFALDWPSVLPLINKVHIPDPFGVTEDSGEEIRPDADRPRIVGRAGQVFIARREGVRRIDLVIPAAAPPEPRPDRPMAIFDEWLEIERRNENGN